jgi:hypothetical protein
VGKIKLFCEINKIRYRLISPATWKAHHGLLKKPAKYAKILKDKIIKTVIGLVPRDPDVRSAILIGMCHIEQVRTRDVK